MIGLLWKEYREKRIWALPLVGSVCGLVLLGKGYTFAGDLRTFDPLLLITSVVGLLMGTCAYATELGGEAVDFLYSRPASWKKVLLAKLMVAFGLMLAALIPAAVIYRLTCPAPYVAFATPARLAEGIGRGVSTIGIPYLIGAACSVALPGMVGGALTLVIAAIVAGIEFGVVANVSPHVPEAIVYAWPVGLAIAAVVTVRFGLTLKTAARAGRYALIAGIAIVCVSAAGFIANGFTGASYAPSDAVCYASPDGKYVVLQEWSAAPGTPETAFFLVRLSDGARARLPVKYLDQSSWGWVGSDMVYLKGADDNVETFQMDSQGRLHRKVIKIDVGSISKILPSPDHRLAAVFSDRMVSQITPTRSEERVQLVDLVRARPLRTVITSSVGLPPTWWQSNTEFGYFTRPHKKGMRPLRHIVKVVE